MALTKQQMSNAQILNRFEIACFNLTHYPSRRKVIKEFEDLELEIANRLHLSDEEIKQIRECGYVE